MHSPEPYGLLIDGDEPTERDSNFVGTLLRQLSNNRAVYQVESLRLVRDLPDGGYVIVQHMGGILKAIIKKKGPDDQQQPIDGIAHGKIPMLFSGMFEKLTFSIDENYLPLHLSQQTRRRLSGYGSITVPERINLNRFAVEYPPAFQYFEPIIKGDYFKHTQCMRLKPTWYSGAMGEVVQIVTGYGKPSNSEFADDSIENSVLTLPADVAEKVEAQLSKRALPGYTGYPHEEGHIQYDYKQAKNDVVSFDHSGKPWLVRISAGGVYAMPLPVIPATTTEAFREYMNQVQDNEILKILDRFGGMPSGETFPEGRAFQAWIRAGVIIKVCDAGDFYQHNALYAAAGWSTNSRGSEAFNTCYGYAADGRVVFHAYKLRLDLSPVQDQGWIPSGNTNSSAIFRYISDLYKLLDVTDSYDRAIIYKIKNAKLDEIEQRVASYIQSDSGSQREFDYWDNYTTTPITSHSGSVTRVSSGIASLPVIRDQYAINAFKIPNIAGGGCESFSCTMPEGAARSAIACDVIIFGSYIEDQLKVVKFFKDPRDFKREIQSTFEDIMIVGQWEKTETVSRSGIVGELYTSDFDDRRELAESSTYTHIRGIDLGYGNPVFATPPILYMHGGLSRSRYYKHEITTKTISGNSLSSAVCVPNFNRDAILYAYQETTGSEVTTEKHEKHSIIDPTSYDLWTYDPAFHFIGSYGKGRPLPKTGDYVYVYNLKYSPNERSDFADQGDWFGVGDGYIDVSAICAPYTDSAIVGNHQASGVMIGGEAPYMEPYSSKNEVSNKTSGYVGLTAAHVGSLTIHRNVPARWYFDFSPQDDGAGGLVYFQRDCCRVMFGDSSYVNISDEGGSAGRRKFWGHTRFANHSTHHYFFGVINE